MWFSVHTAVPIDKTCFDLSTRAVAYGVRERTVVPVEVGRARTARFCSRRDGSSPRNTILRWTRSGCSRRAGKHSPTLPPIYRILLSRRILGVGDAGFEPAASSL